MHRCIHAYMHTYIHTYVHTYIHTYLHTYILTYIHTYTHIYIYIYTHQSTYLSVCLFVCLASITTCHSVITYLNSLFIVWLLLLDENHSCQSAAHVWRLQGDPIGYTCGITACRGRQWPKTLMLLERPGCSFPRNVLETWADELNSDGFLPTRMGQERVLRDELVMNSVCRALASKFLTKFWMPGCQAGCVHCAHIIVRTYPTHTQTYIYILYRVLYLHDAWAMLER